ncbi:nucleotidyltransferase substrate binding protein [Candidatus Babeliales bacterium]|nr:nucleotidyltransferase substrate binding protein [Candidatus Babeliales bacterium]
MEIVRARYQTSCKTLKQLNSSLEKLNDKSLKEIHDLMRNAVIKCFEYSTNTFYYFLKTYLTETLKISLKDASPQHIFFVSLQEKLLIEKEYSILEKIFKNRDLIVSNYSIDLAESISENAGAYYQVMHTITERFSEILKQ